MKTYSGGMRRRLDLAVSLIAAPPVLFLDEPTTGLDPRSRNDLWDVLRGLVADGTTLLLTTQYLEEADQLCDDIVVIDKGRVIAAGTPTQLKDQAGRASVVLTVTDPADLRRGRAGAAARLRRRVRRAGSPPHHRPGRRSRRHDPDRPACSTDHGIAVDDLGLKRPSLDDVFLHLTGHRAETEDDPSSDRCRDRDDGGPAMTTLTDTSAAASAPNGRPSSRRSRWSPPRSWCAAT